MDTASIRESQNPAEEIWALLRETDLIVKETARRQQETDLIVKETALQMKETDRRMAETDRRMKETGRRMAETDRQMKETDRQMKETDRRMAETDRMVKETSRRIGELGDRFGELAEHLVAPGIAQRFNDLGYHFDDFLAERVKIPDASGRILTEIDLLLENRDYSIAVEVKSRPKAGDVEHHIRRLEILREHKDRRGDRRKIRGAIAGAVFSKEGKETTLAAGLYVIEQSGDTMKLSVPDGFVPREW